ncbi:hypothetical protein AAFF_G00196150 [Aldrovandia affinis]|uniref:Uncharacterized protein n=1 Tax=Aldrovandia affinis TaxID=143900 RepID=A0AAD7RIP0_9TELE|nr:hypothetical protein AAFF_G00196150 [Aldrovandia affinis]
MPGEDGLFHCATAAGVWGVVFSVAVTMMMRNKRMNAIRDGPEREGRLGGRSPSSRFLADEDGEIACQNDSWTEGCGVTPATPHSQRTGSANRQHPLSVAAMLLWHFRNTVYSASPGEESNYPTGRRSIGSTVYMSTQALRPSQRSGAPHSPALQISAAGSLCKKSKPGSAGMAESCAIWEIFLVSRPTHYGAEDGPGSSSLESQVSRRDNSRSAGSEPPLHPGRTGGPL